MLKLVAHELKEIDEKILDHLKQGQDEGRPWGRNTPSNIAEDIDSSRQWVTTRLQMMESADYFMNIGGGVYEFISDPREDDGLSEGP